MTKNRMMTTALTLLLSVAALAQNIEVTGIVKDERGESMPGVGVIDKTDPKNGTVTDLDGKYVINVKTDAILEFSFLGYKTVLEEVKGRTAINVKLDPESSMLEQTVVIGYGTSKKQDLTGAVTVVEMEDVKDAPVTSVAEALQGRIAGMDIVSGSGEPGEGTSIQIRGARSISAGNEPLIVVDGVVDAVSDLNEINPSDIVSISVLKDVSSTAIYGSRGANGVIVVTTSAKPKADTKLQVTVKSSTGFQQVAGKLDLMNATEYAEWQNMIRMQAYPSKVANVPQTSGTSWPYYNPSLMGKGTDWVDVLAQTGVYNNQYVAFNSSTKGMNIWASFGYTYNRGVVIGQSYHRYTGRAAVDTKLGRRITLGMRFNITYYDAKRTNAAVSGTNTNAAIFLSPLLDTESTWNQYGYEDSQGTVFNNPYISAKNITNVADRWSMNIIPWVKVDLGHGLSLNSNFSFTRDNDMSNFYSPSWLPVAQARHSGGTASRAYWDQQKLLSETTLNYKNTFGKDHNFEALVGFTASRRTQENASYSGTGFLNDEVGYHNMTGIHSSKNYKASSYKNLKTTMSVLGRVNYN